MGEVIIANEVIKKLKEILPDVKIVLSTITDTGNILAKKNPLIDKVLYLPLDFPPLIEKFLNRINPDILVIVETELWPNLIRIAKKKGVKIILINGRISDKSFRIYKKFRFFFKSVLKNVDVFSMRSKEDKDRIIYLGAEEERVKITGNIKFDLHPADLKYEEIKKLKERLKIKEGSLVFVAGSTHYDEEEKIISVYLELLKRFKNLILIIAPRHIERTKEIENILKRHSLKYSLLTAVEENSLVILVNTIGELFLIYHIADVVFVGGSLVKKGGHNILEPLYLGKPVLFGPYMENFREIVEIVEEKNAGIKVNDEKELEKEIEKLLTDRKKREEMEISGKNIFSENQGALQRNIELIKKLWES